LATMGKDVDPGARTTANARLALARGQDVATTHPMVLLPSFRDRELQHAVLTQALWKPAEGEEPNDDENAQLVSALEGAAEPSGLEQLLLAVALERTGETERAATVADQALARAPGSPLATGLLKRVRPKTQVAVAEPAAPSVPTKAAPTEAAPPAPEPAPAPAPEPAPAPVEPTPPKPAPADTTPPASPSTPAAKPKKPKKPPSGPPKGRMTPAELTTQGCKLVRAGKAQQGFGMLQKAFDANPRDTKVTLCMAEGHMKLSRLPSARAMVERVLRATPRNKRALMLAAKIEDRMGNKRNAVDYYKLVLKGDPTNATATAYVEKHGG
ncbi:MAG: tetratricopeptide repeat protein, partial [Myxococcota bacterium]